MIWSKMIKYLKRFGHAFWSHQNTKTQSLESFRGKFDPKTLVHPLSLGDLVAKKKIIISNYGQSLFNLIFLFLIHSATSPSLQAQDPTPLDTRLILTEEQYIQIIKDNHPIVRRANLLGNQAAAAQQKARGAFDPKLFGNVDQKSFDQKDYFTIGEGGVKMPTWYGMEFKASYLWSDGDFLNPENKLPTAGQAVLGVSANVLQGLLIDERRAALAQAQILQDLNEAERKQIINDLILAARKTYWEWLFAYQKTIIERNALDFAEQQFIAVRESFLLGDKPAIDTLESAIAVQNRQIHLNNALLDYQNAKLMLSNFLWSTDNIPLKLSNAVLPPALDTFAINQPTVDTIARLLQQLPQNHPSLQVYTYKLAQLEVDRKLKTDQLKPKLQLQFNLLSNGGDFINNPSSDASRFNALFTENYKWGARFSFPLLLRKERASIELNQVKILGTEYNFSQKRLELQNKLETAFQTQQTLLNQIDVQQQMVQNYQRLLDAENEKLRIGESSIFLINSRQQKLVEAQLKMAKLQAELQKAAATLVWAAGLETL